VKTTSDLSSKTFGASAEPTRRANLARLSRGEATVAEPFAMSLPAISRHFEVGRPVRLAFTFAWGSTGFATVVTITFAGAGDATLVTFHQAPFVAVESRDSHDEGWSESFDRLADFLAKGPNTG